MRVERRSSFSPPGCAPPHLSVLRTPRLGAAQINRPGAAVGTPREPREDSRARLRQPTTDDRQPQLEQQSSRSSSSFTGAEASGPRDPARDSVVVFVAACAAVFVAASVTALAIAAATAVDAAELAKTANQTRARNKNGLNRFQANQLTFATDPRALPSTVPASQRPPS